MSLLADKPLNDHHSDYYLDIHMEHIKEEKQDVEEFLANAKELNIDETILNTRVADEKELADLYPVSANYLPTTSQNVRTEEKDDLLELSNDVDIKEEPIRSPTIHNEDNQLELFCDIEIKEEPLTNSHNETYSSQTGYSDGAFTNNRSTPPVTGQELKLEKSDGVKLNIKTEENIRTDNICTNEASSKYYYCDNCVYRTVSKKTLANHMKIHDRDWTFSCKICSFGYKTMNALKKHSPVHNEKNDCYKTPIENFYFCNNCPYKSASQKKLESHLLDTDETKSCRCKGYTMKNDVKRQISPNSKDKLHSCGKCAMIFKYKSNLKKHMLTHNGEKLNSCNNSLKKFTQISHLNRHLSTHSGENPHSYKLCAQKTHNKEKNHSCNICTKKYTEKSSLKLHLLTHTGEEPLSCGVCAKKFTQMSHFKSHLSTHSEERPHFCINCPKKFKQKHHLINHMLTHSGEKINYCNICTKKFAKASNLSRHLLTHSGEKPYSCQICTKKYSQKNDLKRHSLTHSGEKPYSCDICAFKTTQSSSLKRHLLRHLKS